MKTVVVDTLNGLMVAEEMRRSQEKGYDKWTDIATYVWSLVQGALKMRDDLSVIFLCHSQTERDDNGNISSAFGLSDDEFADEGSNYGGDATDNTGISGMDELNPDVIDEADGEAEYFAELAENAEADRDEDGSDNY